VVCKKEMGKVGIKEEKKEMGKKGKGKNVGEELKK
jgi:hypothetical protein